MPSRLCFLIMITLCAGCSSLTPEQLEFNRINNLKDSEIAIQRFGELADKSIGQPNSSLEVAARSTNNRINLLNSQERYAEASEVAKEAIAHFEQYNDPQLRTVVVGLLLNQSSSMKNLGETEAHLQLLKRAVEDYQDDESITTQTLVATAYLGQVDAYLLAEDEVRAREIFEIFDERYMQSGLYQSFGLKTLSTTCYVDDPCQPYAAGEHWLNPKFFEDRSAWYRQQFDSRVPKLTNNSMLDNGEKNNRK